MARELTITDGANTVEFVDGVTTKNFRLVEYAAALPKAKRGGVFQASPLGNGRVLVMRQYENVQDALIFQVNDKDKIDDQDDAIDELGTLLQLLMEKAVAYWKLPRQPTVYMTRKARNETGRQYALIAFAEVDGLPDLYGIEFDQIVMEDITIKLERFPWQSVIPGSAGAATNVVINPGEAVISYATRLLATSPVPVSLWQLNDTSGTTAVSSIGAGQNGTYYDTILNDLQFLTGVPAAFIGLSNGAVDINTAAFRSVFNQTQGTAMIWVRSSGGIIWTSGFAHPILYITATAGTLYLYKTADDGQIAFLMATLGGGTQQIYLEGIGTTEWLCLTVTWNSTAGRMRLYMNGVLVSQGPLGGTMTGTVTTAVLGSTTAGSGPGFSGNLAHPTVWNTELTAAQVAAAANTAATLAESSSQGAVMVTNSQTLNNLTHVYTNDVSVPSFSSNLANSIEFNLAPAALANNDIIYFGRHDGVNPIPFNSLVFDIATPGNGYTLTWQYYNGSTWVTLTTQDNTNQLKIAGVNSVHWVQPSNWTTVAINGLTTYWVRGIYTSVSGPTVPTQKNRPVYTARLPFFELQSTAVSGEMPALARFMMLNKSSPVGAPVSYANRIIMGLRPYGGASDQFSAYINISDRQNPPGITVAVAGGAAFQTSALAPSGRRVLYDPASAAALASRVEITIGTDASASYTGRFHAYIRAEQSGGAAGDVGVQLRMADGYANFSHISDVVYFETVSPFSLLDMGEVVINPSIGASGISGRTKFYIYSSAASGTPNLFLYDLILIPVEYWYGDIVDQANNSETRLGRYSFSFATMLDIDGVTEYKKLARTTLVQDGSQLINAYWNIRAMNDSPSLLPGTRQRVWCITVTNTASSWRALPEVTNSVQVTRADRWLGHRGAR